MTSEPHSTTQGSRSNGAFGDESKLRMRDAWRRPDKWAHSLAHSRSGLWLIGVASFLETIIVPIPIEVVLIPYMLARRDLLWIIALVTTAGCLAGAAVGYGVGYFLYDSLGRQLIDAMGWGQDFQSFQQWFDKDGFWAVLAIGVTPIPFQVAMLAAGVSAYPILLFILAATVARGIRYFGLALLVKLVGERAMDLWQRHKVKTAIALLVVVVAVFALNVFVLGGGG
jgi:membrane protein YqaA with SNARE-associated domain